MNFVFLMDPLETVIFEKDTTFMFMLESYRRGHNVYYVPKDGLSLLNGHVCADAIKVGVHRIAHAPFTKEHTLRLTDQQIDAVFIRPDPPFDAQYLMNTWMLDLLPKHVAVINRPQGIRSVNEKVWASQFSALVPPTLISADTHVIKEFIASQGDVIAKPTDAFGGKSVFHIKSGDTNTNVILEHMTHNGKNTIIVQRYIPDAKTGDKRILLLNGDPLGAVLRVHSKDDHRNNFFAGGSAQATTITPRDLEIIATLKPHLIHLGLHFVGIDIIGDYLIEVNVTSPTCLQEMNSLYNVALETKVIDYVESVCPKH